MCNAMNAWSLCRTLTNTRIEQIKKKLPKIVHLFTFSLAIFFNCCLVGVCALFSYFSFFIWIFVFDGGEWFSYGPRVVIRNTCTQNYWREPLFLPFPPRKTSRAANHIFFLRFFVLHFGCVQMPVNDGKTGKNMIHEKNQQTAPHIIYHTALAFDFWNTLDGCVCASAIMLTSYNLPEEKKKERER